MRNFFLMTRGRTGSTAVIDELNKSNNVTAMQELFLMYDFHEHPEILEAYDQLLPYDLWKRRAWWLKKLFPTIYTDIQQAHRYISKAENIARGQGANGFGFKLLSHHFDQRPYLKDLLNKKEYRAIYLTRNLGRQVISGMVANRRGVYNNTGPFEDSRRYHIDPEKFQELVEWESNCVKNDRFFLNENGFSFIVVSYEEYCFNRQAFFGKVFNFLGLPAELPPSSCYSIMIKDLRQTIANYDAVVSRAEMMGISLD